MIRPSFKDKVVMIAGAASGIGEASARLLLSEGAEVFAIDRDQTRSAPSHQKSGTETAGQI